MKILINDIMQIANNVPTQIKTPALADRYNINSFTINFDEEKTINCIGFGYTDATIITITNDTDTINVAVDENSKNGLYPISEITTKPATHEFTISHNGTFIGRVAIGTYRQLGTGIAKEIGFYTTDKSRTTLSGQVISGAGGYSGRTLDLDVRYKIDRDIYNDIKTAYISQISKGYPYFINTECEQHKLPTSVLHFYGRTDKPISKLQSSSYKFLYSYKFQFIEAF